MENRRIAGAVIALVAVSTYALLPVHVAHFSVIGQELVWEALAIVFALGLALMFLPTRHRKRSV